jgi:2-polyprenyl-3-methyl-5-hydroxy-6-metoxy-1,4-benzoquinol methylase
MVECARCGLVYQNPRPDLRTLARHYNEKYNAYQYRMGAKKKRIPDWRRILEMRFRCDIVRQQRQSPGKLMDVGCGNGQFLRAIRRLGWHVEGVEMSENAAIHCRDRYGIEVFGGTFENAAQRGKRFDAVTFWDVLEHLPSPTEALKKTRMILKKNGFAIIRVPNVASYERSLFGRYWAGWDLPRHLFAFDRTTLGNLLEKSGFNFIYRKSPDGYPVFVNSFRFLLGKYFSEHKAFFRTINFLIDNPGSRLLAAPFFHFVGLRVQKASVLTAVARPS